MQTPVRERRYEHVWKKKKKKTWRGRLKREGVFMRKSRVNRCTGDSLACSELERRRGKIMLIDSTTNKFVGNYYSKRNKLLQYTTPADILYRFNTLQCNNKLLIIFNLENLIASVITMTHVDCVINCSSMWEMIIFEISHPERTNSRRSVCSHTYDK